MRQNARIVFATCAEDNADAACALTLAESLRSFGGALKDSPVWLYLPVENPDLAAGISAKAAGFGVVLKACRTPGAAREYFFAMKAFAAAAAESAAAVEQYPLLAWLDPDNVIVQEPAAFILADGAALGCRPVMHQLIGSEFALPADEFWSRAYDRMGVDDNRIFPVTTPVDEVTIRAYFNSGMLVARPERGILREWPVAFEQLYGDPFFREQCRQNQRKRIFLHQVALAGAVLAGLKREEIALLDESYNYPFFFFDQYPAGKRLRSLDDAITLRHDGAMFHDPGFYAKAGDGSRIIGWLKGRLPAKE